MVNEFPQAEMPGEGGRQEQTGIGHQAVIVKDDTGTVGGGGLRGSIYWVLLLWTVLLLQNHYPRFRRAPSGHFRMLTKRPPSVDSGLADSNCEKLIQDASPT